MVFTCTTMKLFKDPSITSKKLIVPDLSTEPHFKKSGLFKKKKRYTEYIKHKYSPQRQKTFQQAI